LFYVVGSPAEAKRRLLHEARGELAGDHRVVFAHRYVTGGDTGKDDEIGLAETEFLERVRHRLFAMHWESGRRRYGIGMEINYWLAVGLSVVVKGSRAYLPQAFAAYPEMIVLWIGAGPEGAGPASSIAHR
jgi:ribose 1,5-bisphosphokinase